MSMVCRLSMLTAVAWQSCIAGNCVELGASNEYREWVESQSASGKTGSGATKDPRCQGVVPIYSDMSYLTNCCASSYNPVGEGSDKTGAGKSGNALPVSFDSRAKNWITPVKNQGGYGTCWAHAVMASLEAWVRKSEGSLCDFSENNLANLHGFDHDFTSGGNGHMAAAYFLRWCGPVLEKDDPYPNWGGSREMPPVRHVQSMKFIPIRKDVLDNDLVKTAILNYGAVVFSYFEDDADRYYNAETGGRYYPYNSGTAFHAAALVGWDDGYSRHNFKTPPAGDGAFIVKNSWGTSSRKNGYFYISYYDKSLCMRQLSYAFDNAELVTNYDAIYQYDPLGQCSAYNVRYGANVFTATGEQELSAVGFFAMAPRTEYEIKIYSGGNRSNPQSGTFRHSQTGTTPGDFAGYFTVPLSKNIWLKKNELFSVAVHFASTPGCDFPLAIERFQERSSERASANPGESFYSYDGENWHDLTSSDATANFCCKAYAITRKEEYVKEDLPEEYTIHFEANGGKGNMSSQTYRFDATPNKLPKNGFVRTGYSFLGWTLDPNGTYAQRADQGNADFVQTAWGTSYTLFAVWQPITYQIRFNYDDPVQRNINEVFGYGTAASSTERMTRDYTYDSISALPMIASLGWSKQGYSFAGWATTAGGSVAYLDGQGIMNVLSENGKPVDLYTVWKHVGSVTEAVVSGEACVVGGGSDNLRYLLQLRFGGGSFEWMPASWRVEKGTEVASINEASGELTTRSVKEVRHVVLKATSTYDGENYSASYDVYVFPVGSTLALPYEVRFVPDAGSSGQASGFVRSYERDNVLALPLHVFTAPVGKRFAGWACSNGRRYDDGMLVFNLAQPGETVTMTAIWEADAGLAPPTGLVAYYPLNGNAVDGSAYANHGTVHGAVPVADRNGKADSAMYFNGTSWIEAPSIGALANLSKSATVAAWVKFDSNSTMYDWYVLCRGSASCALGLCAYNMSINTWSLDGAADLMLTSSVNIVPGQWTHIAMTLGDGNLKLYVNGQIAASRNVGSDASLPHVDSTPLYIGKDPPGSVEYCKGALDEIRIYNRALTADEVWQLAE